VAKKQKLPRLLDALVAQESARLPKPLEEIDVSGR
jgi:hypothetical protein